MQTWECVTLFCIFMISPPHCSTSTIQQQNKTPLLASTTRLADIRQCGQPDTRGKVQQGQKRGFPEGKVPLDPLSVSRMKLKRKEGLRWIKGSQKIQPGAGSLQITKGQNTSFTEVRSGESASVAQQSNNNTNQQRVERSGAMTHIINTEKNPSGRTRTSRTSFGLAVDRIGLGRLPSGRR